MAKDLERTPVADIRGGKEEIYGCKYHPTNGGFITYGEKHVKFYTRDGPKLESKIGKFGENSKEAPRYITSCAFTHDGQTVAGSDIGSVYIFDFDGVVLKKLREHGGAVTGLCPMLVAIPGVGEQAQAPSAEKAFITGGLDGRLLVWSTEWELTDSIDLCMDEVVLANVAEGEDIKGQRGAVKAIDHVGNRIVVGTIHNEIYEVNLESKAVAMLMTGHRDELWALDMHPSMGVAATGGDDKLLRCVCSPTPSSDSDMLDCVGAGLWRQGKPSLGRP